MNEPVAELRNGLMQEIRSISSHQPDTPSNETISSTTESWSSDIEMILSNVLSNCNLLLIEHKKLYFYNQELFKYFKIPLIILASLNSVFSVGLNNFINQDIVSVITCLISLICACISSIELFLQLHQSTETSLIAYQGYEILSRKISSTLKLERKNRESHGLPFLTSILNECNKLFESSLVLKINIPDKLINYKINSTENILLIDNI
jgi:hypothetical protein